MRDSVLVSIADVTTCFRLCCVFFVRHIYPTVIDQVVAFRSLMALEKRNILPIPTRMLIADMRSILELNAIVVRLQKEKKKNIPKLVLETALTVH